MFIHLFNAYLWSTYYVSGWVYIVVDKTDKNPYPHGINVSMRRDK